MSSFVEETAFLEPDGQNRKGNVDGPPCRPGPQRTFRVSVALSGIATMMCLIAIVHVSNVGGLVRSNVAESTILANAATSGSCDGPWTQIGPVERGIIVNKVSVQGFVLELSSACGSMKLESTKTEGGLMSALSYNGKNMLLDSAPKMNIMGSTFWPSPQSAWGWPPPPEINDDAWTSSVVAKGMAVNLQSPDCKKLGISVEKQLSVDTSRGAFIVKYIMRATTPDAGMLAPWEITRVPPGGLTFYPTLNSKAESGSMFQPIPLVNALGHSWFVQTSVSGAAGADDGYKLFANATTTWLAHASYLQKAVLVKVFKQVAVGQTAPGEANIELYATRVYEEVENQGPLQKVLPGNPVEYTVCWYIRKIPDTISVVPGDAKLLGFVQAISKLGCE